MKLMNETILGVVITELAKIAEKPMPEILLKYKELFENYIDYTKLEDLLVKSEPKVNWDIILQAKSLALGKCDMEGNDKNYPLCSIFSNLSLDGSYPTKKYYAPTILNIENIFPNSEKKECNYNILIQEFFAELDLCMDSSPENFDSFLIVIDTLLRKYFWSIPTSCIQDNDVSFYYYIRTAMAIAAVLVQEGCSKDTPYMVAAGHFSGIQNYIFAVSKVGAGGVTKRLRARSFFVNAMVSALAHYIVHKFKMPMVNILMLTGGKFYILLPNIADAETMLQTIESQTTDFLYEKFKGNLSLELVWETVADEGIYDYSGTVTKLSGRLERKKKRLLYSVLTNGKKWNTERFVVYQDLSQKSMCTSCRSALVDAGQEMCPNCEIDTEIGGRLPKIKMFSFSRKKGQYKLLDNYYLNLDTSAGEENYLIMKLNNSDLSGMYDKPTTVYFAVNNVPIKNSSEVKTFGEIAEEAKGSKKLGILKADVDTLGFLFSEGLRNEKSEAVSVSRVNTLSGMLDLFFGGYLQNLIKSKYKNVYCVFSGGDDLFFIGPWSDMPNLAIDINDKFHEYTGGNPCMTLSAAICMAESGGHISTLAENCESKLDDVKQKADEVISNNVKQKADKIVSDNKKGRNQVYFLDKIMTWNDFKEQIKRGGDFVKASKRLGTGIMRRLVIYSTMYQNYLKDEDTDSLMFLPLFANDMMRNQEMYNKDPDFHKLCKDMYKNTSDYRKIEKQFYYVEFCARYALELTREERKNG